MKTPETYYLIVMGKDSIFENAKRLFLEEAGKLSGRIAEKAHTYLLADRDSEVVTDTYGEWEIEFPGRDERQLFDRFLESSCQIGKAFGPVREHSPFANGAQVKLIPEGVTL